MNEKNVGIIDYLCSYLMYLFGKFVDSEDSDQEIKKKTLWLCRWPEGLKDIVRDIINRIYEQFIDMLSNTCSAWNGDDGNAAIMMDE
ncbi:2143_t:CDS:1, partial [Entrophospora sp. SA101]